MAYKRKRGTYKKRPYKKRRVVRKRTTRAGTVMVKRTFYQGNWTMDTVSTAGFWRYIGPDVTAFNNFSEFASVFDEYKVHAIKWTFRPAYDNVQNISSVTTNQTLSQTQAYAHVCVDPASTVPPSGFYNSTTLNTFLENDKVKTYTLNRPFSVYYRPKCLGSQFNSGSASVMESSKWTRTNETGVSFRGFHMFLQQNGLTTGNVNVKLDQFLTFYISFRNLK